MSHLLHLCLLLLLRHSLPTLSWPLFSSWFQGIFVPLITSSGSRHQEFIGLLRLCLPCMFNVRACLVILLAGLPKVCHTQLQCCFLTSSSACSWLVFCHSSLLLISVSVSGRRICRIIRRQSYSIFLVVAADVLQVSMCIQKICVVKWYLCQSFESTYCRNLSRKDLQMNSFPNIFCVIKGGNRYRIFMRILYAVHKSLIPLNYLIHQCQQWHLFVHLFCFDTMLMLN